MKFSEKGVTFFGEDRYFLKRYGLMKAIEVATEYRKTHKTPFIYDLYQLAAVLGEREVELFKLLKNTENNYKVFSLQKKNGGIRKIYAPSYRLCWVQGRILREILSKYSVSPYATAYIKGKKLTDNANPHINKKYLLKIDITDFFGSITFEQVLSTVFNKNYYRSSVGVALTTLCCYKGTLVQGAPTSPMLSNLVMKHFDDNMGEWCKKQGVAYSRYCDDITFSSDKPLFHVYSKAKLFLESMGFELNRKKTHFVTNTSRQTVTGLVVNKKVSVPSDYKRTLRKEIYYFLKYGEYDTAFINSNLDYYSYLNSLLGKTAYVLSVEPENAFFKESKLSLLEKLY